MEGGEMTEPAMGGHDEEQRDDVAGDGQAQRGKV